MLVLQMALLNLLRCRAAFYNGTYGLNITYMLSKSTEGNDPLKIVFKEDQSKRLKRNLKMVNSSFF